MSLFEAPKDFKSTTNESASSANVTFLPVTAHDVRTALGAGFSLDEVEYMLDLPKGRVSQLLHVRQAA